MVNLVTLQYCGECAYNILIHKNALRFIILFFFSLFCFAFLRTIFCYWVLYDLVCWFFILPPKNTYHFFLIVFLSWMNFKNFISLSLLLSYYCDKIIWFHECTPTKCSFSIILWQFSKCDLKGEQLEHVFLETPNT